MTRQELLVEQYEDALFALIMDKVAEVEGQKAIEENQRLKASGEVVIPEELNRRCKQTIRCKTAEKHFEALRKGIRKSSEQGCHRGPYGAPAVYNSLCNIREFSCENAELRDGGF